MKTIQIEKNVFQVTFNQYKEATQARRETPLQPNQIRFLIYPFITSVYWAKRKHKAVRKQNAMLYYQTVFKQFKLNLN
jgi:hypothetical protein